MSIVESLVWLFVGYVVWSLVKGIWFVKTTKVPEQTEFVIYVEKRAGVYYAYQYSNKLFLAQGGTLTEMVDRIVQRTQSSEFVISADTDENITNELVKL